MMSRRDGTSDTVSRDMVSGDRALRIRCHCPVYLQPTRQPLVLDRGGGLRITHDFTRGGQYGIDNQVRTKEQADRSLAYPLAVALLDGNVMPAQFTPDRSRS
jgi:hypothetical protein